MTNKYFLNNFLKINKTINKEFLISFIRLSNHK